MLKHVEEFPSKIAGFSTKLTEYYLVIMFYIRVENTTVCIYLGGDDSVASLSQCNIPVYR